MESALILVELTKIRILLTAFVVFSGLTLIAALVVAAVHLVRYYDKWIDAIVDDIDLSAGKMQS